jgi:hypothetical protein
MVNVHSRPRGMVNVCKPSIKKANQIQDYGKKFYKGKEKME